jgi:hypothetical protein
MTSILYFYIIKIFNIANDKHISSFSHVHFESLIHISAVLFNSVNVKNWGYSTTDVLGGKKPNDYNDVETSPPPCERVQYGGDLPWNLPPEYR